MSSSVVRRAVLAGIVIALFVASVVILMQLVPGPHSPGDYLIIGCLATLVALMALFVVLITTWAKIPNQFFKKRKR
jgi:hypothetical protein